MTWAYSKILCKPHKSHFLRNIHEMKICSWQRRGANHKWVCTVQFHLLNTVCMLSNVYFWGNVFGIESNSFSLHFCVWDPSAFRGWGWASRMRPVLAERRNAKRRRNTKAIFSFWLLKQNFWNSLEIYSLPRQELTFISSFSSQPSSKYKKPYWWPDHRIASLWTKTQGQRESSGSRTFDLRTLSQFFKIIEDPNHFYFNYW